MIRTTVLPRFEVGNSIVSPGGIVYRVLNVDSLYYRLQVIKSKTLITGHSNKKRIEFADDYYELMESSNVG